MPKQVWNTISFSFILKSTSEHSVNGYICTLYPVQKLDTILDLISPYGCERNVKSEKFI